MLTSIANFFTKEYLEIAKNILNKHPDIKGFTIIPQVGEFVYTRNFLFLIDAAFSMKLVNVDINVFNEVVFNAGYDNDNGYKIIMKQNPEAEKLVDELEDAIKEFNKKNGFEFLETVTEIHSLSGNGLYLYASLNDLEEYFERHGQYVQ